MRVHNQAYGAREKDYDAGDEGPAQGRGAVAAGARGRGQVPALLDGLLPEVVVVDGLGIVLVRRDLGDSWLVHGCRAESVVGSRAADGGGGSALWQRFLLALQYLSYRTRRVPEVGRAPVCRRMSKQNVEEGEGRKGQKQDEVRLPSRGKAFEKSW